MRALLILAVACSSSVAPKPVQVPGPVVVERVPIACLDRPPPQPVPLNIAGPSSGCPDEFAVCLDLASAKDLLRYLGQLQDYAANAWRMCERGPIMEDDL